MIINQGRYVVEVFGGYDDKLYTKSASKSCSKRIYFILRSKNLLQHFFLPNRIC